MRAPGGHAGGGSARADWRRSASWSHDDRLLEGVANAQRERARTLNEMAQNSLFFFCDIEAYDDKAARKNLTPEAAPVLQALRAGLQGPRATGTPGSIHEVINAVAQRYGLGLGKVAQPLRVAVSGGAVSPPIDITVALLGRADCASCVRCASPAAAHLRSSELPRTVVVDRIHGLAYLRAPSVGL